MDDLSSQRVHVAQMAAQKNPRRRPASESVSLRHAPRKSNSASTSLQRASSEDGSPGSSMDVDHVSQAPAKPNYPKGSSGESSNPEKWFERSNNNVKNADRSSGDDDPPFFLQHSSEDTTSPGVVSQRAREQYDQENSDLQVLSRGTTGGSDEYRDVIDDLTVENKKLKRRLRQYEKQQTSQLHLDALFEVRFHGLAQEKKRELEEMLRNFVTKLERTPQSNSAKVSSGGSAMPASLRPEYTASSSRVADSGYASLSAAGVPGEQKSAPHKVDWGNMNSEKRKDIHTYLSDIPPGLLPTQTGRISEKEKKKIVVRRLEQLFAGRDSATLGHQQPLQQELVAQSAAQADRRAGERDGDLMPSEGCREARIMWKTQPHKKTTPAQPTEGGPAQIKAEEKSGNTVGEDEDGLIEQRPTRPLDLDPHRAQIPSENMQYIRHLGFSPPDIETMNAHTDGHGWIYLNVLHNMAQLHLTNVTVEFVRQAIADHSKKLEISSDGRKLRWKGGRSVTHRSNSDDSLDRVQPTAATAHGPTKAGASSASAGAVVSSSVLSSNKAFKGNSDRSTLAADGPNNTALTTATTTAGSKTSQSHGHQNKNIARACDQSNLATSHSASRSKFAYMPLFQRHDSSSSDKSTEDDAAYGYTETIGKHCRGTGTDRREETPLIFYNNRGFYTDLSGDPYGGNLLKETAYNKLSANAIGSRNDKSIAEALQEADFEKGPISHAFSHKQTAGPVSSSSSGSVKILTLAREDTSSSSQTPDHMEFEASGIGGVNPADNFSINVRSQQNAGNIKGGDTPGAARRRGYPMRIRHALQKPKSTARSHLSVRGTNGRPVINRDIIASKRHELPASQLPEAIFYHNNDDDDDDDDDNDAMCYDTEDEPSSEYLPLAAPQRMDWAARSSSGESEWPIEDDSSSDESIDLLATARALDPETIRIEEREFDSAVASRLAEEIPAGSSAALAEGGSGFTSPELATSYARSDVVTVGSVADQQGPQSGGRPRGPSLKRNRRNEDRGMAGSRATKSAKLDSSE